MPTLKKKLIVLAGPQSSGKTTAFNFLKNKFTNFLFLPETNQYSLISKNHLGCAFVTPKIEKQITRHDLNLLKELINQPQPIIVETSIFHAVYSYKINNKKTGDEVLKKYLKIYKQPTSLRSGF